MESSGPLATAQFPAETPSIPFALPPPVASNTITTTTTTTTATFEEKKDPRFSFEFGEPEKEQPIVTENASNEPTNEPSLENAPAVTAQDDLPDGLAQLAVDTALKMESSLDPPVDLSYSNMDDLESYAAEAAAPVPQDAPMQAYAKLEFPDGQFYVHTLAVELGRDKQAERQRMRQARLQRRARKEQARRVQEQENVEAEAESESGQSRKKETQAMSNISESGGIVGVNVYPDSDESSRPSRRRKRKPYLSNDSSQSQSIAPANLHTLGNDPPFTENLFDDPFADKDSFSAEGVKGLDIVFKLPDNARDDEQAEDEGDEGEEELYGSESPLSEAQSPQSTPDPGRRSIPIEDFSDASSADDVPLRIKHKHKRPKSPKREKKQHVIKLKLKRPGDPVKLAQKKEKAAKAGKQPSKSGKEKSEKPGKPERGEKAEKADKQEALERVEKVEKAEKPKSKPKPAGTPDAAPKTEEAKRAAEQNEIQVESKATESATPATSAPPPTAAVASAPAPTPPNIPAELPAGSILAGLAPEEIPQKRKGPGRPPKNGVMSKRDEAIIKRKKKELQKLGLEIPPLGELLAMARAEGATKKDPKPDDGKDEDKDTPKPSIEIDPTLMNQNIDATPTAQAKSEASAQLDKSPGEKADAKPKRVAKSPSPQKPESEYTEEELRKPAQTYVVLIHEALSKSPTGIMDLQQIYDAMQKMYPFYKYRCQTHGWQSSVRHNLISSDAFEEAGKIGKGRLWKINPNVSIDKEKKRKAPTPPPERPTYQYPYTNGGQYPYGAPSNAPPAYGQPYRHNPYGNPYGPPTVNGVRPPGAPVPPRPGAYYSPYASNPQGPNQDSVYGPPSRPPYGAPGHFGPQLPPPPNGANPAAPNQSGSLNAPHPPATSPPQPHPQQADEQLSRQPSGTPQPQQTGLGSERTIEAIMDYHKVYISKFPNEEQEKARNLLGKRLDDISTNRKTMDHSQAKKKSTSGRQ
ncbi:hypothetical protein H2203_004864 [Taxawa tesnikishii (nom. ined.)]|nr:hypothetical protein H2203_004864 [Dothideales sp. JES 119]